MRFNKREIAQKAYGPEEARAEHRACVDYHTALVNSRFTIMGLYIAAMAFIAGVVFKPDISLDFRAAISLLACLLTVCVWILELRSHSLVTDIAYRGIEIERNYWKLNGEDSNSGFFSRQHKLPEETSTDTSTKASLKVNPDDLPVAVEPDKQRAKVTKYISHKFALNFLYGGCLLFWFTTLAISSVYWLSTKFCH